MEFWITCESETNQINIPAEQAKDGLDLVRITYDGGGGKMETAEYSFKRLKSPPREISYTETVQSRGFGLKK